MRDLEHLRRRLPLIVFLLLLVLVAMLLGLACLSGDPMQAIERLLSVVTAPAMLVSVWTAGVATLSVSLLLTRTTVARGRASPALLQRFRF